MRFLAGLAAFLPVSRGSTLLGLLGVERLWVAALLGVTVPVGEKEAGPRVKPGGDGCRGVRGSFIGASGRLWCRNLLPMIDALAGRYASSPDPGIASVPEVSAVIRANVAIRPAIGRALRGLNDFAGAAVGIDSNAAPDWPASGRHRHSGNAVRSFGNGRSTLWERIRRPFGNGCSILRERTHPGESWTNAAFQGPAPSLTR